MNPEIISKPHNRTALYTVLALMILASAGYVLHYLSKKHYARITTRKLIAGMQKLGKISSVFLNDAMAMDELHTRVEDRLYRRFSLRELYQASNLSEEEVAQQLVKVF